MRRQFSYKNVFRMASPSMIEELFQIHNVDTDLEWDDIEPNDGLTIYRAWSAVDSLDRRELDVAISDIHDLANEDGVKSIVDYSRHRGIQLPQEFQDQDSHLNKVLWIYLNHRDDMWKHLVRFLQADEMAGGRYFHRRPDVSRLAPDNSPPNIHQLETAVSGLFKERQSRGDFCHIEHDERPGDSGDLDYYFVYLSDYPDTDIQVGNDGEIQRVSVSRAFEIIFIYDRHNGTLDTYTPGGEKMRTPLEEMFHVTILGEDVQLEATQRQPYQLNVLKDPNLDFNDTDPEDGIENVFICQIEFRNRNRTEAGVFKKLGRNCGRPIQEQLGDWLNQRSIPLHLLNVTAAHIKIVFREDSRFGKKTLRIRVSSRGACNLKSQSESLRVIGEKYLRRWGIDESGADPLQADATVLPRPEVA